MESPKLDKKIAIHAYKYNGWLYRTWEFPRVIKVTDEYICVSSQGARIITNRVGSNKHYRSKVLEPSIWYFFKDKWFNLIYQFRNRHIRVYINLASPYYYEDNTLKYIDFDLDFVNSSFEKNELLKRVDNNEFLYNAKTLNYPNALKNKIILTASEIEKMHQNGELNKYFDKELLNISGDKYNEKKRSLQKKTKRNKFINGSKKYKEALNLVAEEIATPYIPKEYIDQFESLYTALSERANIEEIEKKYNSMSKTQLLMEAYNGKTLNINVLSFFLAKFASKIEKLDYVILEQILLDKNISNDLKIFSLEQIKLSELDHDFVFFNNMTNKEININSMSDFEFERNQYYVCVSNYIDDQLFKDPSLKPLAIYTLKLCYEYYFGGTPPFEKTELGNNIVQYIRSYFDNSVAVDQKFVNWVNNLFTFKKLKN